MNCYIKGFTMYVTGLMYVTWDLYRNLIMYVMHGFGSPTLKWVRVTSFHTQQESCQLTQSPSYSITLIQYNLMYSIV